VKIGKALNWFWILSSGVSFGVSCAELPGSAIRVCVGLPYVLIFPDMSSFSRVKLPSG
jgi:hypothetical protein